MEGVNGDFQIGSMDAGSSSATQLPTTSTSTANTAQAGPSNPSRASDHAGPSRQKGPHSGSRARTGCITCRLRKKRCDEIKPVCLNCTRLGIECMGYGKKRPEWLRDSDNAKHARQKIREKVVSQRATKTKKDERTRRSSSDGTQPGTSQPRYSIDTQSSISPPQIDPNLTGLGNIIDTTSAQNTGTAFYGPVNSFSTVPFVNTTIPAPDLPMSMTSTSAAQQVTTSTHDAELEEMWKTLFGATAPMPMNLDPGSPTPLVISPSPFPTLPCTTHTMAPPAELSMPNVTSDFGYLHHYTNVILPLQFRTSRSLAVGDLVVPLAFKKVEVLTSISSLSALHLASKRSGLLTVNRPASAADSTYPTNVAGDNDAIVARSAHRDSIERLRFVDPFLLASEEVIFPALFAVSYTLFMGGVNAEWREVIAMCQKSLAAAIVASPDLTGDYPVGYVQMSQTPWQRYRSLIEILINTDVLGAVSQNRASRLLPVYRNVLTRFNGVTSPGATIDMSGVTGNDNTTLLAIAEITALSEWKDRAEENGTLSQRELLQRAAPIEKLLSERNWRNERTATLSATIEEIDEATTGLAISASDKTKTRLMSNINYAAAKVFLGTIVNGPYPKVPEIANAVVETIEAIRELDTHFPGQLEIHRKLVFAITIAGCHSDGTPEQEDYFRQCFSNLGPEAAFGNTRSALMLMEEVWRKRKLYHPQVKVCWRQTMIELGWEGGLLLI